jgi:hypothetical protein
MSRTTPNRGYRVPETPENLFIDLLEMITGVDNDVEGVSGGGMSNPMTTQGDIIRGATSGAPQRLPVGSSGQVLTVVSGEPSWATPAADVGFANPMIASGDIMYGGSAGVATRLAGNVTATKKFLTQTGNGSVSAAPSWNVLVAGDIPDLSATYLTGNQLITLSGEVTGSGATAITTTIAAQDSAFWHGKVTDETGSGLWVFNDSPTLITPILGVATGTSLALSGNLTANAVLLDDGVAGIDTYDATPTFTGKVVKIRDSANPRDLGRLWVKSMDIGNDPYYSPGSVPYGGGNYLHNIRSTMLVSGNPNDRDKWEGITSWVNIDGLTTGTTGSQDFYAFNGETTVMAGNTYNLWTVFGGTFTAALKGSGNINDGLIGMMAKSEVYGSGNINKLRGVQGWAQIISGSSSSVTAARGIYGIISHAGSGTITAASAGYFWIDSNSGVMTTAAGVRIANTAIGGSGTSKYGLYIEEQSVATPANWTTVLNIYSAGDVGNLFDGYVKAKHFIPSSSTVPTNGLYLPASNTLGWAINSVGEVQLTSTALSPITSDGNALGTSSLMWGDLFLASGAVINFNNGDVTLTHSADALAIAGGVVTMSSDITVSGLLKAGSTPTTLTDPAGKILSASLNTVAVANGGTGATSASSARTSLGLGTNDTPQFAKLSLGTNDFTNGLMVIQAAAGTIPSITRWQQLQTGGGGANDRGLYIAFGGGSDGTTSRGYFGITHTGSGSDTFWTGELADAMAFNSLGAFQVGTNNAIRLSIAIDGGVYIGSPTGGSKGAGTLNATAVYDDNVLLTDWVFDLRYDGTTKHPKPEGGRLYSLLETQSFAEMERRLPWMPTREAFESERTLGGMITRLWFGQEQQQIFLFDHETQIKNLTAELEAAKDRIKHLEECK